MDRSTIEAPLQGNSPVTTGRGHSIWKLCVIVSATAFVGFLLGALVVQSFHLSSSRRASVLQEEILAEEARSVCLVINEDDYSIRQGVWVGEWGGVATSTSPSELTTGTFTIRTAHFTDPLQFTELWRREGRLELGIVTPLVAPVDRPGIPTSPVKLGEQVRIRARVSNALRSTARKFDPTIHWVADFCVTSEITALLPGDTECLVNFKMGYGFYGAPVFRMDGSLLGILIGAAGGQEGPGASVVSLTPSARPNW